MIMFDRPSRAAKTVGKVSALGRGVCEGKRAKVGQDLGPLRR